MFESTLRITWLWYYYINNVRITFRRCQQWKEALGFIGEHKYAKLTPEEAYNRIRVCRAHFNDKSFTSSGKHLLNTAVPSKLLTILDGEILTFFQAWIIFLNKFFSGNEQKDDSLDPSNVLLSSNLDAYTQTDMGEEFDQGKC